MASVMILLGLYLLNQPIRFSDTDLWYHLSGGRFLLETGRLANPLDLSFIEPKRDYLNYFWGFQGLVYVIWSAAGYLGLIVMKALVLLATAWFAAKIVISDVIASSMISNAWSWFTL